MKVFLYYSTIDCIQCLYDICLVRAFEIAGMKVISNWPLYAVILFRG